MITDEASGESADAEDASLDAVGAGPLLQDREYISLASLSLPAASLLRVLQLMEERRSARRLTPAPAAPLPEMGAAELRREIAWRLEVLPPEDAKAVAVLARRLTPRGRSRGSAPPAESS